MSQDEIKDITQHYQSLVAQIVPRKSQVANPACWEQKFGYIKRVDKGWITIDKGLESWRFER